MAVQFAFAESRKMFAAPQHSRGAKPRQKLARIYRSFLRIIRYCPRAQHTSRRLQREIEHRREVHVESQRTAVPADDFPVLTKKRPLTRSKHFRCRRCCSQRIAKTIDRPALEINTGEQSSRDALSALVQQPPSLFRT